MRVAFAMVALLALGHDATAQPADAKARAEAAASEGANRFKNYDYVGAIERFKAAYGLEPDAGYLFNIAQAYRLAGDCVNAADYYNQFLELVPDPPNADKVRAWFAQQQACAKARKEQEAVKPKVEPPTVVKPVEVVPARTTDAPDPGRGERHVALALAGVSAASLGVAGFFTWHGNELTGQRDVFLSSCDTQTPCSSADVNDFDRRGRRANIIATTGFVVGGAALAGSVVLFLMARSNAEAAVVVAPAQGGAVMVGAFEF